MKILKIIVVFFVVMTTSLASAQQLPQFTQYMFNTISINPAYAGSREKLNVTALHRNQWAGLEGNPITSTLSLHSPLGLSKIGLGFTYINDNLGFENTNFIYGDFSYTLPVSYNTNLAFGLKAGATNYSRPFINSEGVDPDLAAVNQFAPNMGAGVYLSSDRWYVGVSAPRFFKINFNEKEFSGIGNVSYYAIAGAVFDIALDFKFRPSVIAKITDGAPPTYDVTAGFLGYEKFWFGASYRFNDASNFGAFMDYQISKDFRLGYAYDLPTGNFRPYTGGTHEVILIFELGKRKPGIFKSPRYF